MKVLNLRLQSQGLLKTLVAEAERLHCDPRQLAAAILSIAFKDRMIDGILDGDDPKKFAPHYAQPKPRGVRGERQTKFLEWLTIKLGGADTVTFSYKAAAAELGWSVPDTGRVARTLMARGEIIMTRSGKRNHPSSWALAPVFTWGEGD